MTDYVGHASDFSLKAYPGDFKTLLAFNFASDDDAKGLAGFTIAYSIPGGGHFYLWNSLVFEHPGQHAQDANEPPLSTLNAPIHKFRWVHVPGLVHQGQKPAEGVYTYEVTPRFFDDRQRLVALDPACTARIEVPVQPFRKGGLRLGFTRGFVQSEAFVHRFGKDALLKPAARNLILDTGAVAGNAPGTQAPFTFAEAYDWLGSTARRMVFEILAEVEADPSLKLDMFAYDLTEPDIIKALERLAAIPDKLRLILDNAKLHSDETGTKPEDQVEVLVRAAGGRHQVVMRGRFARYSHDKVLLVRNEAGAVKVLTGSTNFALNGIYINSNHVLVYDDVEVADWYEGVFNQAWTTEVAAGSFIKSPWSTATYTTTAATTPSSVIRFSPHEEGTAKSILGGIVSRVNAEAARTDGIASILFAVMTLNEPGDVVYQCLNQVHGKTGVFSYGISDPPAGVSLDPLGFDHGVLVTGKPGTTELPPPFDQVPPIQEHQIHHKFVVCGFNQDDAVVYCGSSNLAEGGEHQNGDNLIAISDRDVATAFAIEALTLVDHFDFFDNYSKNASAHGACGGDAGDQGNGGKGRALVSRHDGRLGRQVFQGGRPSPSRQGAVRRMIARYCNAGATPWQAVAEAARA